MLIFEDRTTVPYFLTKQQPGTLCAWREGTALFYSEMDAKGQGEAGMTGSGAKQDGHQALCRNLIGDVFSSVTQSRYPRTPGVLSFTKQRLLYINTHASQPAALCRLGPGCKTEQIQPIPAAGASGHSLHAHCLCCWGPGQAAPLFLCFPPRSPSEQA